MGVILFEVAVTLSQTRRGYPDYTRYGGYPIKSDRDSSTDKEGDIPTLYPHEGHGSKHTMGGRAQQLNI